MTATFTTLTLDKVRDVLENHQPTHYPTYLGCRDCMVRECEPIVWSVEHVMAAMQETANITGGQ
jgi:hypothetical protein